MTPVNETNVPQRLGGWLLLLSRLLLVWHPAMFVLAAAPALDSLSYRGAPLGALLVARLVVTAFGVAAAISLTRLHSQALLLTKLALVLSAVMDLLVYTTPYFPNNRMPGDTPFYVAWSLVYHTGWLIYLSRSRHVRRTFEV